MPATPDNSNTWMDDDVFWTNLQPWLLERGYKLRPRYQPGWQASWLAPGFSGFKIDCEDFREYLHSWVMDAVRIKDGAYVMLKWVKRTSKSGDELEIARLLSQRELATDSHNYCVDIHDILDIPGSPEEVLLVMPLLYEVRTRLEFDTVGEVASFFGQIIEGLEFMHQHNIAYRDCKEDNILADSRMLYNEPPHPLLLGRSYDDKHYLEQHYTSTKRPIRYYFIDFGLAKRYASRTGNTEPSPWSAGMYDVPEFRGLESIPTDPFPVDVFMLGATIRRNYLEDLVMRGRTISTRRVNLEWMEGLVKDMMAEDPEARPKIEEVSQRFKALIKDLGFWKLRAPVNRTEDNPSTRKKVTHWITQTSRMLRGIPAIPLPPPRPLTLSK